MTHEPIKLSQQCVTALRRHLKQAPGASLLPALQLGRRAVALGLETLELARLHDQTPATWESTNGNIRLTQRTEIFFAAANTV